MALPNYIKEPRALQVAFKFLCVINIMMFKNYTAARLASSKSKRCICCDVKEEKIQGYCPECLKIDSPEMKAMMNLHENESQANSNLGTT